MCVCVCVCVCEREREREREREKIVCERVYVCVFVCVPVCFIVHACIFVASKEQNPAFGQKTTFKVCILPQCSNAYVRTHSVVLCV